MEPSSFEFAWVLVHIVHIVFSYVLGASFNNWVDYYKSGNVSQYEQIGTWASHFIQKKENTIEH